MRHIICAVLLLAVRMSGFSQEANVVELPFDGSVVKKEITFAPPSGTGDPMVVEAEFQKNPNNTFSMTLKSSPRYEGKFLYFFGGKYRPKSIEKTFRNIWFEKKLSKNIVERYFDGIEKEHVSPTAAAQYFKMDSADFTITFSKEAWNGNLVAYAAITAKKGKISGRQIIYMAKLPFAVSTANPCEDPIVKSRMEKLNNLSNDKLLLITEIGNLKKMSCDEFKSASFTLQDTAIESGCPVCSDCPDFIALKNEVSDALKEYLDAVKDYNALLAETAKKYEKPCPTPSACACNCAKFKEIREKVGSLLWDLQTGRTTKAPAKEEFKKIQSALPCTGSKCKDKDCEALCKTCDTYKAYKKDSDELQKLLK